MIKSIKVIEIVLFSFLLIGAMLFSFSVKAAEPFDIEAIAEVKVETTLSEEEFKEKTKFIDFDYEDDSAINHTAYIPEGWSENVAFKDIDADRKVSNKKVLVQLAKYNSPPDEQHDQSYMTVEAMQLEYEIGVKNWFINYALLNGLSLQNLSVDNARRKLEALYVEVQRDKTFVVRTKAFINGRHLIMVRFYQPIGLYEKNKAFQAQVVRSFKLKTETIIPIEEMLTYGFLNQAYFDYPSSWNLIAQPVRSINYMTALLHRTGVEDKLEGQINVRLYNKGVTELRAQAIKKFREKFKVKNYEIGGFIEEIDANYHNEMSNGSMQVYQLKPTQANMIDYELWVSISENEDYFVINSLITPSRDQEFYSWARNQEIFEQVVKTTRGHKSDKSLYEYLK